MGLLQKGLTKDDDVGLDVERTAERDECLLVSEVLLLIFHCVIVSRVETGVVEWSVIRTRKPVNQRVSQSIGLSVIYNPL